MKRISLFVAACTLCGVVSCSQDEGKDVAALSSAENGIGFISSTSRADVLTISNLKDDEKGFYVFGIKASSSSWDEDMNGENNYIYSGTDWEWDDNTPSWPSESTDYPINFYAYYVYNDVDNTTTSENTDDGVTVVKTDEASLAITYAAPTKGQTDILVATTTTDVRPVGDKLPLTFEHILSKVNFDISVATGYTVYSQAMGLNQICSERTYTFTSGWGTQDADDIDSYSYMTTQNAAIVSTEDLVATYGDLMLLPQTTASWQPVEGVSTVEGSHIFLIYRAVDINDADKADDDVDVIGYTDAASHPDYNAETDSKYAGTPLFVKVGYPLSSDDFVIEKGKGYTYDINLCSEGATNGYLISEYYYDEDGNETKFEVKGKDISDPMSDGYINFNVYVNDWSDSTTSLK